MRNVSLGAIRPFSSPDLSLGIREHVSDFTGLRSSLAYNHLRVYPADGAFATLNESSIQKFLQPSTEPGIEESGKAEKNQTENWVIRPLWNKRIADANQPKHNERQFGKSSRFVAEGGADNARRFLQREDSLPQSAIVRPRRQSWKESEHRRKCTAQEGEMFVGISVRP